MDKIEILQKIEQQRKNLKSYYLWQVFWGVIFLVLVIVSSIFLGFRSQRFWLYIVIPLLVIGSFWIYIQTTLKSVNLRLNQRALGIIVENLYPSWTFYPQFKLATEVFRRANIVSDFINLTVRNGLVGYIDGFRSLFVYLAAGNKGGSDSRQFYAFAGVFINVELKSSVPEFGVYPRSADVEALKVKRNLLELPVTLSEDFKVLAASEDLAGKIEVFGPMIIKYSHLCGGNDKFYFTTFGQSLNVGLNDHRDLVNFDVRKKIDIRQLETNLNRLESCMGMIKDFIDLI